MFRIQKGNLIDYPVDAIVIETDEYLDGTGGIRDDVFHAAGADQLLKACEEIGFCPIGYAAITPGFNLKAKYIIHAGAPYWLGGNANEPHELYSAYRQSLELAAENGCKSVGLQLLSIRYGYPVHRAWRRALLACRDFLEENPGIRMDITFAVPDYEIALEGMKVLWDVLPPELAAHTSLGLARQITLSERIITKGTLKTYCGETEAIFFNEAEDSNGFLSNAYPTEFELDKVVYTSVEQCLSNQRCLMADDWSKAFRVMESIDAEEQRSIASKVKLRNENVWVGTRQALCMRALHAKFEQNPGLKRDLLRTGDAVLVKYGAEDPVWGCGLDLEDCEEPDVWEWKGMNLLGFALMELRKQYQPAKEEENQDEYEDLPFL